MGTPEKEKKMYVKEKNHSLLKRQRDYLREKYKKKDDGLGGTTHKRNGGTRSDASLWSGGPPLDDGGN
jgi:hypothetical protein